MLTSLQVRAFAVIDALTVPFGPGLTVVTGETGAGKSLLMDALSIVVGERAGADVVRPGATAAEIVASFHVNGYEAATVWLDEHGLMAGDECEVRRIVAADRSRAFINGTPVPIQRLREFGELLIDLHGQHEHHSLMRRETQRALLDIYAGAGSERAAMQAAFAAWAAAATRLRDLTENEAHRAARESLLRYQLEEIRTLAPLADEWQTLNESHRRAAHVQELASGITAALDRLSDGEQTVTAQLAEVQNRLSALERFDSRLNEANGLLASAALEIAEAARSLNRLSESDWGDAADLAALDTRLGRWHELARKHRVGNDELPRVWQELEAEYAAITSGEQDPEALAAEVGRLRSLAEQAAAALSRKRTAAGPLLAGAVTTEIQRLGLAAGRFEVALTSTELSPNGHEDVEFLMSAQPDSPLKPLARAASGGELSRISLAVQVVLADVYQGPTLVFDEVDVGIGGAVAEIVGQRLRQLARKRQIVCITHLAQVAAQGDAHMRVSKETHGARTHSTVAVLSDRERVEEVARMLGGLSITARTRALARDMLHG
ncbi:MAG: DNA repair protein RecN [Gammaproteobacteria bacterium]|nr:DNA repair protein RecN [Gammaproteobacteria bacterium]